MARISLLFSIISLMVSILYVEATIFIDPEQVHGILADFDAKSVLNHLKTMTSSSVPKNRDEFISCLKEVEEMLELCEKKKKMLNHEDILNVELGFRYLAELQKLVYVYSDLQHMGQHDSINMDVKALTLLKELQKVVAKEYPFFAHEIEAELKTSIALPPTTSATKFNSEFVFDIRGLEGKSDLEIYAIFKHEIEQNLGYWSYLSSQEQAFFLDVAKKAFNLCDKKHGDLSEVEKSFVKKFDKLAQHLGIDIIGLY